MWIVAVSAMLRLAGDKAGKLQLPSWGRAIRRDARTLAYLCVHDSKSEKNNNN